MPHIPSLAKRSCRKQLELGLVCAELWPMEAGRHWGFGRPEEQMQQLWRGKQGSCAEPGSGVPGAMLELAGRGPAELRWRAGRGQIWAGKEMEAAGVAIPVEAVHWRGGVDPDHAEAARAPIRRPQGPLRQGFAIEQWRVLPEFLGEGDGAWPFRECGHFDVCNEL
ncbi:hypothetical protein Taro_018002 [Colocasia esculenta]|uniref:Uncharacterized protein n=1 Tax=Colocasia esculenta TaxID=4460 RepID=A0A843UHL3_COLES|nr:hypothetical protein [Colocasia esculenta]